MSYSELSYPFPGTVPHAFAHIAAREEAARLARKMRDAESAYRKGAR